MKLRNLAATCVVVSVAVSSFTVSADSAMSGVANTATAPSSISATAPTNVSNNPYRAKISQEFLLQLDPIVTKIFTRGRSLSQANYVNYLTQISDRMKVLMLKPEYVSNTAIQNIIGYIEYEVSSAREYISAGKLFIGDLTQSMDNIFVANNGNLNPSPVVSGRQSTAVSCANRGGMILPIMAAPSDMSAGDTDKTIEYRQYLTCIGGPDPVQGRYENNYGAPYGVSRSGGYLEKSVSMTDWEKTANTKIQYIYNNQGQVISLSDFSN